MPGHQVGGGEGGEAFEGRQLLHRQRVEIGRVGDQPGATSWTTRSSPSPSMSMAEREAKWAMRCTRCAGQSMLVQ